MPFFAALSEADRQRFLSLLVELTQCRSHSDLLVCMQGDMQHFVPHDVLIAVWGDLLNGPVHADIVSVLPGVRSSEACTALLRPLSKDLFKQWLEVSKRLYAVHSSDEGFRLAGNVKENPLVQSLAGMRTALVHGLTDQRERQDCLYVAFSRSRRLDRRARVAFHMLLPSIDTALRQVAPVSSKPDGLWRRGNPLAPSSAQPADTGISDREAEIMRWVEQGKTNSEIGMILDISTFTVKNHLQRIFKKLDVYNRAQAVARFKDSNVDG